MHLIALQEGCSAPSFRGFSPSSSNMVLLENSWRIMPRAQFSWASAKVILLYVSYFHCCTGLCKIYFWNVDVNCMSFKRIQIRERERECNGALEMFVHFGCQTYTLLTLFQLCIISASPLDPYSSST